MLSLIFFSFCAFLMALLPVYLWGYGASYLLDTPWNRRRFLLGMFIGGVAVALVWFFSSMPTESTSLFVIAEGIFIIIMSLVVFLLIARGSVFAKGILKHLASTNIAVIAVLLITTTLASRYLSGSSMIIASIIPLLIASLIEESSKHLMSIGLMSQDFRFSRSDIVLFTIFVVLGFVFVENLLYLAFGHFGLSTWIWRSFSSIIAHLLSATLCAYVWWRALSYEPFSLRYILIFLSGFTIAVLVHLGYNLILEQGSVIGLLIYMIVGYVVVTRGMIRK